MRIVLLAAAGVLAVGVLLVSGENVVGSSVAIGSALGLIAIIVLLGRAVRVLVGIAPRGAGCRGSRDVARHWLESIAGNLRAVSLLRAVSDRRFLRRASAGLVELHPA
jgi:hypothetical protein